MIFRSSFSGLCGSPGQPQYDAGNSYQDALAHHRRAQGLEAVSVDLGIMLSVGILAEMGDHTFKLWENALGIREHAFHALIKSLVNGQKQKGGADKGSYPTQVCLGLGTADILAAHQLPNPPWFVDPRFKPGGYLVFGCHRKRWCHWFHYCIACIKTFGSRWQG